MKIPVNRIVQASYLQKEYKVVREFVQTRGEVFIFHHGKPEFVLMTLERYTELTEVK